MLALSPALDVVASRKYRVEEEKVEKEEVEEEKIEEEKVEEEKVEKEKVEEEITSGYALVRSDVVETSGAEGDVARKGIPSLEFLTKLEESKAKRLEAASKMLKAKMKLDEERRSLEIIERGERRENETWDREEDEAQVSEESSSSIWEGIPDLGLGGMDPYLPDVELLEGISMDALEGLPSIESAQHLTTQSMAILEQSTFGLANSLRTSVFGSSAADEETRHDEDETSEAREAAKASRKKLVRTAAAISMSSDVNLLNALPLGKPPSIVHRDEEGHRRAQMKVSAVIGDPEAEHDQGVKLRRALGELEGTDMENHDAYINHLYDDQSKVAEDRIKKANRDLVEQDVKDNHTEVKMLRRENAMLLAQIKREFVGLPQDVLKQRTTTCGKIVADIRDIERKEGSGHWLQVSSPPLNETPLSPPLQPNASGKPRARDRQCCAGVL